MYAWKNFQEKYLCCYKSYVYQNFNFLRPDPKKYSTIVGAGSVISIQIDAYFLALNKYVDENAKILDVGFGLGYGLNILSIKSRKVNGVDVDEKVLDYAPILWLEKIPDWKS